MQTQSFREWMREVDGIIQATIGVSFHDMPDLVFVRDIYDSGAFPDEAAEEIMEDWRADGCLPEGF